MSGSRSIPSWVLIAVLSIVYFAAAKLGLELASMHPSASAVWPPSGIALAALILRRGLWPAVFLGAFAANAVTAGSIASSFGIATGNTLEALLGAALVERFCGGRSAFERPASIFKFTLFAAILSTAVGATLGVASLTLAGHAEWRDFGAIWLTWWLGDAAGDVILAPLVLLWSENPGLDWDRRKKLEAALLLSSFVAASGLIFGDWTATFNRLPFAYIPVLVWAAFRFSQRETATASFLIAGTAIWGTLEGRGPFVVVGAKNDSLLLLSAFMCTVAVTALILAAGVSEFKRSEAALRFRLRQQAEVAAFGLRALTETDLPTLMNDAVSLIARTLGVEFASILRLLRDRQALLLEAGTGWTEGYVGREMLSAGTDSQSGYTLLSREPVIVEDLRAERRFKVPAILREHGAVSGLTVIIHGEDGPYGILGVHSTGQRTFSRDDVHFLQAMANALSHAVGRKRSEEELRRYAAELESFSYTVAQELRSPLWSITGLSQALMKDFASKMDLRRLDPIQRIAAHAESMNRLIQGLLAYGRFSRVDFKPQLWSLSALLPEALMRLAEETRTSNAEIDIRQPLPEVLGDRGVLVQILVNLVSNAIRFVKAGTVPRVRIWAEERDGFARLYVEDNGIGIGPEHHERIFRIFDRLHSAESYPGHGIGLAIVIKGTAWMGGRTGVESEAGKGSRFWIELPRPPA